jgi:peptidoglycan/LPS O-acetylase OafA/YrhL
MSARSHVPALDGVRAIAILSVMFGHATSFGLATRPARMTSLAQSITWAGVDLFFVLSGVLITGILLRSRERPDYYRSFFLRRTFRIVPLYVAYCLGLFVVVPLWAGLGSPLARHMADASPWYLTYMVNVHIALANTWPPTMILGMQGVWSLCVEEQFYLLWPVTVRRLSVETLARVCLGLAIVALLCRILAVMQDRQFAAYVLLPTRMDGLALGAWVAIQIHQGRLEQLARWAPWALALAATGVVAITIPTGYAGWDQPWMLTLGMTCTVVASAALIVLGLAQPRGALHRGLRMALSTRTLGYVGRRAYALYLLGGVAKWLVEGTGSRLAVVAAMFALAELSWRVLEEPAQRLGHRLTTGAPAVAGTPT